MHKDWLGNARIVSTVPISGAGSVTTDRAFAPYGEIYNIYGSTNQNYAMFTGDTQDVLSGMWDTPNRELQGSQQGRWLSPDPAGSGWNQYAYVTNPNSETDRTGLNCDLQQAAAGGCANTGFFNEGSGSTTYAGPTDDPNLGYGWMVWGQFVTPGQDVPSGLIPSSLGAVDTNGMDLLSGTTLATVGWFNNTVLNPFGHIAISVAGGPFLGLNPASDLEFVAALDYNTFGCLFGALCNPLAVTVVPGVISEEANPYDNYLQLVSIPLSWAQAIEIDYAMSGSAPNYSVMGPLPACDCGTWAQQMLTAGGVPSGPPAWDPSVLMEQLGVPPFIAPVPFGP